MAAHDPDAPRERGTAAPTVASRLFRILDAFSAQRPAMTLSSISRHSGLALTTTHRLVGELTRWGALERDAAGRYRIGLRLHELAALAPRGMFLREIAMPFLGDLYEATHQNVQLGVLDGTEVVYVERLSGRGAVPVASRPGARLPLHATGVGLVLLAHADGDFQEEVLRAPLKRFTDRTISGADRLRRVLADARRDGYVISDRQIELSTVSVAAPVRDHTDTVVASLSIVVPSGEVDPMTLVPAVRAAARGISRALGSATPLAGRSPKSG
ncbi:IclR family transcriptional regulator [Saccharopolyspora erythraea]|uniref:IclR family transcriptional regulator n=1 Tax=Saccharopolyspora erythraea TaxID=1836 RepID=UPI001BA7A74B|nr:IclR family transcriptional regulator [Saccharopolyspora erythraea]QUH00129.1 IclR family transcriptional regulator [Saccharopolyspora erythraea]